MKKRALSLLLSAACALSLVLSACGGDAAAPEASSSAPAGTETPAAAVDQTREIVFAASRDQCPGEQDAYYASMSLGVWEPLITKDESNQPAPALATSWEHNEDATVWTFHLREGVTFSNGTPFNADIVLANFDRMKKGPFESSFYGLNIDTIYPGLLSWEKTDDYTVVLTFESGQPLLDYTMVNYGSAIFEPSCFAEDGTFNGFPIGTGPYVVTENVLGQYCVIERNDNYWGTPGIAQTFRFKVIPDAETRYTALRAGEVQGLCDLGAISPAQAAEIDGDLAYNVSVGDSGITHFLNVNGGAFPFNDVRMRQAVSLALQRSVITEDLYDGFGTPTTNILNYSTPFYKEFPVEEDMEKAKELAAEVLGDERVTVTYLYNGSEAAQKGEAELIASWLSEIGIDCELMPMEMTNMKEQMKTGDYGIARMQQGLSNSEPSTIFRRFMLTSGDQNQNYSLGYHSDEVDALMAEAESALDMDVRTECYNRIQEISTQEFPVVPLFNDVTLMAYNTKLTGYDAKLYGIELPLVAWAE